MFKVATARRRSHPLLFLEAPLAPPAQECFAVDDHLPKDDLARVILAAINRLDWTDLWSAYSGRGSTAYPPVRLLAVARYEIHHGHPSPAQWHHHAGKVDSRRWLLAGFLPSRSCCYNFRDRIAPLLDQFTEPLLRQLDNEQLVVAQRGTLDGTLIAANASRHRLVNEKTLLGRLQLLDDALAADGVVVAPPQKDPKDSSPAASGATTATTRSDTEMASAEPSRSTEPTDKGPGSGRQVDAPEAQPGATLAWPAWMAKSRRGRARHRQTDQRAQQRLAELHRQNSKRSTDKSRPVEKLVVSLSDPEAALGGDKLKVCRPLDNVQLLNDVDSPVVLAYRVVAQVNEAGLMKDMPGRQKRWLGRQVKDLLTDSG
jgi:transposase